MLSVIFNSICIEYQITPVDDENDATIDENNKPADVIPDVKIPPLFFELKISLNLLLPVPGN